MTEGKERDNIGSEVPGFARGEAGDGCAGVQAGEQSREQFPDRADELYGDEIGELKRIRQLEASFPISSDLDEAIRTGLKRGLKSRKLSAFRKGAALAACLLLAVLFTSIRVSPTFAEALKQIPGLNYLVELIAYDKGLQAAVGNDFIQQVGVSDFHEDIRFTVDGIIMDESSLIIFYTIEDQGDHEGITLLSPQFLDEAGQRLQAAISHGSPGDPDPDGDGQVHGQINVNFIEGAVIPEEIRLEVNLQERSSREGSDLPERDAENTEQAEDGANAQNAENAGHAGNDSKTVNAGMPGRFSSGFSPLAFTWSVEIPIDKDAFAGMKKEYPIEQILEIEGQKITFESITVYPTRTLLHVAYDPENTKKIFAFDDLTIVNEQGEEWGRIVNGVSGSKLDENHEILYFQSNYFTVPQTLRLQGHRIRALDKEQAKVTLDLEKGQIIDGPSGLTLAQVTRSAGFRELRFKLKVQPEYDRNFGYGIFSFDFTDSQGNSHDSRGQGTSTGFGDSENYQELTITLSDDDPYPSPITFRLYDYPSRIYGEIDLQIK